MQYREIIAVCSENHTKHMNTLCGQNEELLNVKTGGTYSNHLASKFSCIFRRRRRRRRRRKKEEEEEEEKKSERTCDVVALERKKKIITY